MNINLCDDFETWEGMLPLTYTRPVGALRCGILTIAEKWKLVLNASDIGFRSRRHLTTFFPAAAYSSEGELLIAGEVLPDTSLIEAVKNLAPNTVLVDTHNKFIAANKANGVFDSLPAGFADMEVQAYHDPLKRLNRPWDIFLNNGAQIWIDMKRLQKRLQDSNTPQQKITDPYTRLYGAENIFVEEGASLKAAVINAENGPVYIGKDAQVQENAVITGPFALCAQSVVAPNAIMRADTTIGPYCKVGGEISNSVLQGYSNKGHAGFLGNSVLGHWVNLGADTNTSNLKNTYGKIKAYDFNQRKLVSTGLQFLGLICGDHVKAGINTMFNTGTVVDVGSNVFGAGFTKKHVPAFAWYNTANPDHEWQDFDKFLLAEGRMMARRAVDITTDYASMLRDVVRLSQAYY